MESLTAKVGALQGKIEDSRRRQRAALPDLELHFHLATMGGSAPFTMPAVQEFHANFRSLSVIILQEELTAI